MGNLVGLYLCGPSGIDYTVVYVPFNPSIFNTVTNTYQTDYSNIPNGSTLVSTDGCCFRYEGNVISPQTVVNYYIVNPTFTYNPTNACDDSCGPSTSCVQPIVLGV